MRRAGFASRGGPPWRNGTSKWVAASLRAALPLGIPRNQPRLPVSVVNIAASGNRAAIAVASGAVIAEAIAVGTEEAIGEVIAATMAEATADIAAVTEGHNRSEVELGPALTKPPEATKLRAANNQIKAMPALTAAMSGEEAMMIGSARPRARTD